MTLLEYLAPHDTEDGPDRRGFWERLHDGDDQRGQAENWLWSWWKPGIEIQVTHCWQFTKASIGLATTWDRGTESHASTVHLSVELGFYYLTLSVTWWPATPNPKDETWT